MDKKQLKIGRNKNKLTTNKQVVDMALTLWECSDHITTTIMKTNLNSYFRDRVVRINQRLVKEAMNLGGDLTTPNETAFETLNSTKMIARQLGIIN